MDWTTTSEEGECEWTDDDDEFTAPATSLPSGPTLAPDADLPNASIQSTSLPSTSRPYVPVLEAVSRSNEENDEVGPSRPGLVSHFLGMGFPEDLVTRAIEENGEGDTGAILDTLLTYSVIKKSSPESERCTDIPYPASEGDIFDGDLSDMDSFADEDFVEDISEKDRKLLQLVEMGFSADEASSAIDRCGSDASFLELADSIRAAQMAEDDQDLLKETCSFDPPRDKKRTWFEESGKPGKRGRPRTRTEYEKRFPLDRNELSAHSLPNPMVGFGLPTDPWHVTQRKLPEGALGPPYFYYENVALAPKGVWETFSRFLYDIEPEFVDSKYFSATARKRGYIHNLPIDKRFRLLPIPPLTIHEALPATKKWWPSWDKRTQLNCLQTCIASAKLTERIRTAIVNFGDPPPPHVQQFVLDQCRKWNLVWVGLHKVAPLEPDEVEMLLGFPKNHTRGGGISRTERYRSLGNSFQVDTVGYHLSVLKNLYPQGIRLLSLFSGIGGAEVALHRLGIRLRVVVSVEISQVNRNIVRTWWDQTEQEGMLIDIADVQLVNEEKLKELVSLYGGFDLIIGGSPCNNLAGSNRVSRDGLVGEHSSLFFDYFRILDLVRCMMGKN
uniref:DNA (cytosine-5-)-methyltransferase n=1 Tax=Anthurium amnicola TaxID=1678845 RepID=A0A1D1XR74_9ARAE